MAIFKVIKKQTFITSRLIKAESKEDALDKFRVISSTINPVMEDGNFDEEIDVEERNDCSESAVDC